MTRTLLVKLLRDVRLTLAEVALVVGAFQCLWAKVTERLLGQLLTFCTGLAEMGGLGTDDIEEIVCS